MKKLCVFCVNYSWSEPYAYSEMTASDGYFCCTKEGHTESQWETGGTLEEYRTAILTAEKCPDYELVTNG